MNTLFYQNFCNIEQKSYNIMLKQKRKRNKNENHENQELKNQYYIEELFENYSYDYSQELSCEYKKEIINFTKLKQDLMPK